MANIKLFKFVTGEEIIADVEFNGTDFDEFIRLNTLITIKDAVTLVYRPQEGGQMTVGFAPFMPYSEDKIKLLSSSIITYSEPQEDLKNEFNRLFGSGIVVAQANDAAFKL